jgi:hypothetical protein
MDEENVVKGIMDKMQELMNNNSYYMQFICEKGLMGEYGKFVQEKLKMAKGLAEFMTESKE